MDKQTRIVHEMIGESVAELTHEGKLFFCKYPVSGLEDFKRIAGAYKHSSQFAETFLPIYDRLLIKRINFGAFLMR